jgi:tetratricopeptide (TPR) repeat protein
VYLPDVATTLNNLGVLLSDNNEMELAKAHYQEALESYRTLAKKNPDVYLPDVAGTLNNLGLLLSDNNEMELAKVHYQEALEIKRTLAKKNERAYNLDVCMTAINMGIFYKKLLEEIGDLSLKKEGLDLTKDVRKRLAIYSASNPTVIKYLEYVDILEDFFKNFDKATFQPNQLLERLDEFKKANQTEKDPHKKVSNQREIVKILHQIDEQLPNNEEVINLLSSNYGSLAWYLLFIKEFSDAEIAAKRGLEIDATQEWINSNLALALLYQGKYEEAKALYLQLKDKPYGDATYAKTFLEDLVALEAESITHPDVVKIRKLLND